MPLPRAVARFNRQVTNRLTGLFAPYLPYFGVVRHSGRKTRRAYRTPVNLFPRPGGFVIVLTYGPNADWVRNVLASGGATLETRGQVARVSQPRVFHDDERRAVPAPLRPILRLANVSDFLDLSLDNRPQSP